MRLISGPLLILLWGCTGPAAKITLDDTAAADTDTDTDADSDTDTDADTGPVDLDGDGTTAATDCDDRDPDVHPGATELWNGLDDDCDGRIDADGDWSGSIAIAASAIYEGRRYDFSLSCPFAGTRAAGSFPYTITCTPDPADPDAQRMLGATMTLAPDDATVAADAWAGVFIVTSSNGWDTDGDGTIDWSSFDDAVVSVSQSSLSLGFEGGGPITRE